MKYLLAASMVEVVLLVMLLIFAGRNTPLPADSCDTPAPEHIYIDKVVRVEVPVEVPMEVVVEKPVYQFQGDFKDVGELAGWVSEHLVFIMGNWGPDCDDYALRLQQQASLDGYVLSVQLIENGMLFGKNVSNYTEPHMGNLAVIGNDIYFIEPQPKYFRVVFVCHRD